MPYSGGDDPSLPDNVKKLPATRRRQWVHVFNSALSACKSRGGSNCEGEAFRKANGVALSADDITTQDIHDVEILRTGTWSGVEFTTERLDNMVEAYNATRGSLDPPVKLGHDEGQALIQRDGFPAAGWVEGLRRIGDRLVADFKRVPIGIVNMMEQGLFRKRSSEVRFGAEVGGKVWPDLLAGVSLLGADLPAVESLADIQKMYAGASLSLDEDVTPILGDLSLSTKSFINTLPDTAFAGISPGGRKDSEGKTEPRQYRLLPHHNEGGELNGLRVLTCLSRIDDLDDVPVALRSGMEKHLTAHAAEAGLEVEEILSNRRNQKVDEKEKKELEELREFAGDIRSALGLSEGESAIDKIKVLLETPANDDPKPDPKDDGTVAELTRKLDEADKRIITLEGERAATEAESLVDKAVEDGRLLPAQRDSALKLALRDQGEFTAFIETQPKGIVELGERGTTSDSFEVLLSELEPTAEEVAVAKQLGVWGEEHRVNLIRKKAEEKGIKVPDDFGKTKDADGK